MSTLPRTISNAWKLGWKGYWHQLAHIGDTKVGTLVGVDRFGNSYYENMAELPLRTRWVDYREHFNEPSQIEPGWHAWMSYLTDVPPPSTASQQDAIPTTTATATTATTRKEWEPLEHKPVQTLGRSAYRPYSTTKPKIAGWVAVAKARS